MDDLLREVLRPAPARSFASLGDFFAALRAATSGQAPIDRAIAGGALADRLGYAFAAGYHAALRALVPELPADASVSLCATEAGGAHPRAIATTLRPAGDRRLRVDGSKKLVTLGAEADVLLVVASEGTDGAGRNRLRLVRVPAGAPGIARTPIPTLPFAPEIGHAEVRLDGVLVEEQDVLAGDGYDRYLKPFRTVEDLHVHAALAAHLLAIAARCEWPEAWRAEAAAVLVAVRALALEDPSAPATHVALGGALALTRRLVGDAEPFWASAGAETRARWERDRALLGVAERARGQRLEAAWRRLSSSDPPSDPPR